MLKFTLPPKAAENVGFIAKRLKEAVEGEGHGRRSRWSGMVARSTLA